MRKILFPLLGICILLSGCAHYTAKEGLSKVQLESESTKETKLSVINYVPPVDKDALLAGKEQQIKTITTEKEVLTTENESLKTQLSDMTKQNGENEKKISNLSSTIANITAENRSLKNENPTLKSTVDTQKEELQGNVTTIDQLSLTVETLSAENLALKEENPKLKEQVEAQAKQIATDTIQIKKLTDNVESLQAQLNTFQQAKQQKEEHEAAVQRELASLPPLEEMAYPKTYQHGDAITTKPMEKISVLLIPLGSVIYDEKTIDEIAGSVDDLHAKITIATGCKENVYQFVRYLNKSAVITEEGAIITDYALQGSATASGMTVKIDDTRTLRLTAIDLPQSDVFDAFIGNGEWKAIVDKDKKARLESVDAALVGDAISEAALFGASLYEPASTDWNSFSPVEYRQIDYAWPLADAIIDKGYFDTYRQTHFSEATDAGNTIIEKSLKERTDYLFAKHILPLSSSVVNLGPESIEQDGYARYGVVAEYLIP